MNHNIKLIGILIVTLLSAQLLVAQIDATETNFYTEVSNAGFDKNFTSDYGVDNDFSTDDSIKLQQAIDEISSNGGGTLVIDKGNYSLSEIFLKSNVHIVIDEAAVIRPSLRGDEKNYSVFKYGSGSGPIENVSIRSKTGNRFTIDLTHADNPNVSVFNCGNVSNFLIANCLVEDNYTKFSVVTMGGDFYNEEYKFPRNGVVKDIHNINAHYGYGVVQTQSAYNILFKDLYGLGGATLRMETGFTGLNNLQVVGQSRVGGIDKLVGRNISSTNGNCAVMVSPHAMHNGSVDVEGIVSDGSGFAVRIEGGFVSNKYDQTIGLVDGTFQSVRIKDVKATFGNIAEIKSKHFGYYPEEITAPTAKSTYADDIYIGPSIGAVLNHSNYQCNKGKLAVVIEDPIEAVGFEFQEPIFPEEYLNTDCSSFESPDNFSIKTIGETCPNENNGLFELKVKSADNYTLNFNNKDYAFTDEIILENLAPGSYLACVSLASENFEQCYNVIIDEVSEILGKASIASNKTIIEIYEGTKPFNVLVNGKQVLETFSSSFEINSKNGDVIEVKSAKECEGVYSKTISDKDFIEVYPNPVSDYLIINYPKTLNNIQIFSSSGSLLKNIDNCKGDEINVSNFEPGLYFLKILVDGIQLNKKIIIQ